MVWSCGAGDISTEVASANSFITPYYEWLSDGAYSPTFINGGTVPGPNEGNCQSYIFANASGTSNAAIAFVPGGGGWAGPGPWCF